MGKIHKDTLLRVTAWAIVFVPLLSGIYKVSTGNLSPNPIEDITRLTGFGSISLLSLTLAMRPLSSLTGISSFIKIRKILGLSAFVYALIHLLIFVSLDYGFNPKFLFEATIKKPYVYAGLATLLLMTPRAISSFAKFSKYYGSNKVVIDITVYLSQFFACLHYYWLVKADTTWPIIFILVFVLSIGLRVLAKIQQKRKLVASS